MCASPMSVFGHACGQPSKEIRRRFDLLPEDAAAPFEAVTHGFGLGQPFRLNGLGTKLGQRFRSLAHADPRTPCAEFIRLRLHRDLVASPPKRVCLHTVSDVCRDAASIIERTGRRTFVSILQNELGTHASLTRLTSRR